MQIGTTVFWLGLVIILVPFLGIPALWQKIVIVAVGALVAVSGYRQRRKDFIISLRDTGGEYHGDTYVETTTSLFKKDTVQ